MLEWMHDADLVRDMHKDFASMTIDDCRGFIEKSGTDTKDFIHFAIADENDEYLGTVSLKAIDTEKHIAEFGITIRRCAMRTGIAIEAMRAIIKKAHEMGIDRVYWCVAPQNTRALRFYDKNGYKRINITDEKELLDQIGSSGVYSYDDIDGYIWYLLNTSDDDRADTESADAGNLGHQSPDVSVYMMTYFHEKYVRQAIESVLSQKTGYTFELVISDDCSQDGTADILREYEAEYPDRIRVNINETNIGIPSNIYKARTMCRGRYITNLSGDDYWINDEKIETEVRFLDEHPEYSAAACRIELRMDDSTVAYDTVPSDTRLVNREFTIRDYEKCIPLGTHGLVMRNYFLTEEGRTYFGQAREISEFVDDAVDEVLLLRKGPIYVMDIVSDAHRVVKADLDKQNYNSRYSRIQKYKHHIDLLNGMSMRWGDEIDFSSWYAEYTATGFLGSIKDSTRSEFKEIVDTIPDKYRRNLYVRMIPHMMRFIVARFKRR